VAGTRRKATRADLAEAIAKLATTAVRDGQSVNALGSQTNTGLSEEDAVRRAFVNPMDDPGDIRTAERSNSPSVRSTTSSQSSTLGVGSFALGGQSLQEVVVGARVGSRSTTSSTPRRQTPIRGAGSSDSTTRRRTSRRRSISTSSTPTAATGPQRSTRSTTRRRRSRGISLSSDKPTRPTGSSLRSALLYHTRDTGS
jgi:hypothetical protein